MKKKIAEKLHAQFGHPPKDKLFKLLDRAGHGSDEDLCKEVDAVDKRCQICIELTIS